MNEGIGVKNVKHSMRGHLLAAPSKGPYFVLSAGAVTLASFALALLVWLAIVQVRHIQHLSDLYAGDGVASVGMSVDGNTLILPNADTRAYESVREFQAMATGVSTRLRWVNYDNAPFGRRIDSPSLYRWWLQGVAFVYRFSTGSSQGKAIETAVLYGDVVLQILMVLSLGAIVAEYSGFFAGALCAMGCAGLYPLGACFVAGVPDEKGIAIGCALWSVLPILLCLLDRESKRESSSDRTFWAFVAAGIIGGLGLWASVQIQFPFILGLSIGGVLAALRSRRLGVAIPQRAWLIWSLAGAVTVLCAYVAELYPDRLPSWNLTVIHPIYGLVWLCLGGGLAVVSKNCSHPKCNRRKIVVAIALLAAGPVLMAGAMWKLKTWAFLAPDHGSYRMSKLLTDAPANNVFSWLVGSPSAAASVAIVVSAAVLGVPFWLMRRSVPPTVQQASALVAGAGLIALILSFWHIGAWALYDVCVISCVLLVAWMVEGNPIGRAWWRVMTVGGVVLLAGLGIMVTNSASRFSKDGSLSTNELFEMLERDLAKWLAKQSGTKEAVVLTTPNLTTRLGYYGGLRGLGTFESENIDGLGAAIRILSASTPEEAKELLEKREVKYIAIPSWDSYLDDYARIGMGTTEGTFLARLYAWRLTRWLRPIPYRFPEVNGFGGHFVIILEVTEDQEESDALGRLAEYFVEMQQFEHAESTAKLLKRFPADLGALAARAQVAGALGQMDEFAKIVDSIRGRLGQRAGVGMTWDRRVSLAIVLARAARLDLAKVQFEACIKSADEVSLRLLTSASLSRFFLLEKTFGIEIKDTRLQGVAFNLLSRD